MRCFDKRYENWLPIRKKTNHIQRNIIHMFSKQNPFVNSIHVAPGLLRKSQPKAINAFTTNNCAYATWF